MPVSAEGRVEHQKQNQTVTSQWPVGSVFGVQLDNSCRKKSDPANAENRVMIANLYNWELLNFPSGSSEIPTPASAVGTNHTDGRAGDDETAQSADDA